MAATSSRNESIQEAEKVGKPQSQNSVYAVYAAMEISWLEDTGTGGRRDLFLNTYFYSLVFTPA